MLGHPDLVTPEKKSEFEELAEIMRRHHVAMKQQVKIVATDLRSALRPILGRTGAYRVTRHLIRAASLNLETAAAYARAFQIYEDLYEQRVKVNTKFDPTK